MLEKIDAVKVKHLRGVDVSLIALSAKVQLDRADSAQLLVLIQQKRTRHIVSVTVLPFLHSLHKKSLRSTPLDDSYRQICGTEFPAEVFMFTVNLIMGALVLCV